MQMLYYWQHQHVNGVYTSLLLILYYFIGIYFNFSLHVSDCLRIVSYMFNIGDSIIIVRKDREVQSKTNWR